MKQSIFLLIVLAMAGVAQAEQSELIVSSRSMDGKAVLSVELFNENDVAAFDFTLDVPAAIAKSAKLANCTVSLPGNISGHCALGKDGRIRVIAFSTDLKPLPTGEIGQITFAQMPADGTVKISDAHMFSTSGKPVQFGVMGVPGPTAKPLPGVVDRDKL